MKNRIEKTIREFIKDNYKKDYADRTVDLPNGWSMRMVYYDIDGNGFTDVILTNDLWNESNLISTIKAECDIEPTAYGAAHCVDNFTTDVEIKALETDIKTCPHLNRAS